MSRILQRISVGILMLVSSAIQAEVTGAVQIYSDDFLLSLIKTNTHLQQVVKDECQLVQDIQARAIKAKKPSYQFLWGDMLAYGVCVKKDVPLGLHYMKLSADQGLAEALEQLGRYYHIGKFFQPDLNQAIRYLKQASALNNIKAQIRLAQIYAKGQGAPLDYPIVYSQLYHSITADKKQHQQIQQLLVKLEQKMPQRVIEQARVTEY